MMEPFMSFEAVAVPLDESDVDTGVIFPSRFLRRPRAGGYQSALFHDRRFDSQGRERPDCVLNLEPYRAARILVAGANFGCGSSRESAVHALLDAGFRCVIAPSYGDLFFITCFRNGLLPVALVEAEVKDLQTSLRAAPGMHLRVDLDGQTISRPEGRIFSFRLAPSRKARLRQGLDDCALAVRSLDRISQFERDYFDKLPWLR
jgi:3-isopropylmalate/(R)-2-methylmalate dehydratase small subunit